MERVIAVPNETKARCVRVTKEGKKLTYQLNVIQQPERARACGSGAKSSADRRPVDPPPIVELRIYEGDSADKDITFQMNANYFLFATLEQARPIAQGRVHQDPARLTVLTGTPVAGLVYLDRPTAAGYFLFPDLSVRHEGKYRLSFNLYEELKEEKDEDKIIASDDQAPAVGPAHVTHRLEVKSKPFLVYSAKKFPGLASSTSLSRLVAEQGCRVRIRRDVRLRKRDKSGKEYDVYDDAGDMYTQPSGSHSGRHRSSSVTSHVSLAPSPSRRHSEQDLALQYHQQGFAHTAPPSHPQQPTYQPGPYGQPQPAPYQPQHHQQASYQPTPVFAQPAMAPPPQAQAHPQQGYPPYQQPPHPQGPYHFYPQGVQQSPGPAQPPYDAQYHPRGSSSDQRPQTPPTECPAPSYAYPQGHHRTVVPPPQPSYTALPQVAPPAPAQPEPSRYPSAAYHPSPSRPLTANKQLPMLNTSTGHMNAKLLEPSTPASAGPSPVYAEPPRSVLTGYGSSPIEGVMPSSKRAYGQVFDTHHISGPMRAGSRPVEGIATGYSGNLAVDHDETPEDLALLKLRMSYKRADGRQITKAAQPSSSDDGRATSSTVSRTDSLMDHTPAVPIHS